MEKSDLKTITEKLDLNTSLLRQLAGAIRQTSLGLDDIREILGKQNESDDDSTLDYDD